ncbi:alpha-mannosidase [Diaminobutyricibacter tongyongensis]|uniref:Alpha-mannosidase n=1 Tax=Leifsonia tongyongensis TaxID=1268043 RepID=A0A6L9XV07_9MICO|nr:alpha-mannosidase [Diaminobutyricibacter tongyongensis]NEN05095.1 alpha-mannosidase [Diaminobutyricibacter tongyongensis]
MADQPALRRTYPFDHDRAIGGLRNRAFRTFEIAGHRVELAAEPLLRRTDGGLEQPIRVRSAVRVSRIVIKLPDGTTRELAGEDAAGDLRFFLPATEQAVSILVAFPDLGEDAVDFEVRPVRPWNISLVHHSHFDIGYTDLQGRVITEQLAYLDDALRLAEADAGDGPSAFRWSVESIWVLREWIGRRRPETVERFMTQVRAGAIEIAALPFNMHTETCSTEELHGLLRYACEISQRYGLNLPVAYQTDVPGCVAGTVDALADAGVKYLAVAHNWAGRSVPYLGDGEKLPRLFRWASPAGNSVLVWMTTTAEGMAYQEAANLGFADSVDHVDDLLPLYLLNEETLPFPYDENVFGFALGNRDFDRDPYPWNELHLRVMGRVGDNCPPNRRLSEIVAAWNERWEYPKLEITRTQDFFEQVEAAHADEIETFTGDWNDWWADGIGSAARHLQMNRGAQAALSQAASVDAMLGDDGVPGFTERIDAAWESVELFDEHTWGAANPWTSGDIAFSTGSDQWHWKAEKAIRAEQESWLLTQEVLRAYAERNGGAGDASIWVVNTAGYARGGVVSAFLPESLVHTTASVRLIDSVTGAELAFAERNQTNPVHRDAGRFLDVLIDPVPAFGSRRVDVVVTDARGRAASPEGTIVHPRALEPVWHLSNGVLYVAVDPWTGAIASIRNLTTGAELVNQGSAFGFNAYVHDRLAPRGEFNHLSGFVADSGPDLVLLADRATPTHVAFEDAGSDVLGSWLRYRTFGVGVESIVTTLRLASGADFVDITNRVAKTYTADKESGFFAFPFALEQPTVRFEVSGSVAGTDIPVVPGGADYLHTVRDWVVLHAGARAATLVTQDAPLIQVGDIALPFAPFPGTLRTPEPGTVFSWIHNNIWDTNFPSGQAFDTVFRYRVRGFAAADAETAGVESADLALDLVRPLLAVAADPSGVGGDAASLLELDDRRIRLLGVTRTARGTVLVRLQSLAEAEVTVGITAGADIGGAWSASLVGARRGPVDFEGRRVSIQVPRFGSAAVELKLT